MKKYQVFIDVPQDDEWEEIAVESMVVEAFNPDDAFIRAVREADNLYENFYIWEVTEEDLIE